MEYKVKVNNYIYSKAIKQLDKYIINIINIDSKHKEIIFAIDNDKQKQFIEKIITYKLTAI